MATQPSAQSVVQQLRDAFSFDSAPKYMIMDRDRIFSARVKGFLERRLGVKPTVTSYKSPWQNGITERLILSIHNELLNHIIVFNEDHLRRLMSEYVAFYNKDRCHLSLDRDSPMARTAQKKSSQSAKVIFVLKLGGIQNKYE